MSRVVAHAQRRCAACTNSRLRSARELAAHERAPSAASDTTAMAMMTLVTDGARMATSRMAKRKDGIVWKNSVSRISTSSTTPP